LESCEDGIPSFVGFVLGVAVVRAGKIHPGEGSDFGID
jgi:hypothetical protein